MNCLDFEKLLKKSINEKLSKEETAQIFEHKKRCQSCEEKFQKIESLKRSVSFYREHKPVLSENFHSNLIQTLKKQKQTKKKKNLFKLALVASILVFVSGFFFFTLSKQVKSSKKEIKVVKTIKKDKKVLKTPKKKAKKVLISRAFVKKGKPITIKLDYFSNKNVKNTKVVIKLDKQISFHSFSKKIAKKKTIVWKGDFKKGKNSFPFVVDIKKRGVFKIETVAIFNGFVHKHEIILNSKQKNVQITYFKTIFPLKNNG